LTSDLRPLTSGFSWYYEMEDLGYNYRITDIQCALGISQLQKLPKFLKRRCEIAALYDEALADIPGIEPLGLRADVFPAAQSAKRMAQSEDHPSPSSSDPLLYALCSLHSYHLYVIKIDLDGLKIGRNRLFSNFCGEGIGVNVHYIPVHLHPFYMKRFHTKPGLCPVAEEAYEQILSLPMFPGLTDEGVERVIKSITESIKKKSKNCWGKWTKRIERH